MEKVLEKPYKKLIVQETKDGVLIVSSYQNTRDTWRSSNVPVLKDEIPWLINELNTLIGEQNDKEDKSQYRRSRV